MSRPLLLAFLLLLAACESLDAPLDRPPPVEGGPSPVARTPETPAAGAPAPVAAAAPTADPDPGSMPIEAPGPKLRFTADGHDYGLQEKNVLVAHTAVFYNVGNETLEIRSIKTHCGCAAALLSSKSIPPGGRGTMRIDLNTGGLAGDRVKRVEVETNDPVTPVVFYPISCRVNADVTLDPLVLVLRATRSAGEVTAAFHVIALNDFDLKITEVRTSHPDLIARVGPLPAEIGKKGYRVNLYFGPAFGARDFMEKVTVFTNSRRDPNLTIDVIGSVREAVLVVPERLYFPMLARGQEISRRVYVYRTDGRPLRLTGIEDASGLFTTEQKQVEPGKWEVTVKVHGEAPAATVRGAFIIGTDDPAEPKVSLPFELPGAAR